MKIAMLGAKGMACSYGGVERHVQALAIRLAKRGHKVTVYSRSHCTPDLNEVEGVRIARLPCLVSKHLEMPTHVFLCSLATWFTNFDILHFHSVDPLLFAPILPSDARIVCTSQGQAYRRKKWGALAKMVSHAAERVAMRRANAFIAVSKTLKRYYETKYHRSILYIPNGGQIDLSVGETALKKFRIEPGAYILFVGRMDPTKGLEAVLTAYQRLSPPEALVVMGGSTYTDSYFDKIQRTAPKGVRFLGHVTGRDYWGVMQHAKVFVSASEVEGLSVALLEAMACGVPVIYSDIAENDEVAHGAGLSYRLGDSEDLSLKLLSLVTNSGLRREMGDLARARVKEDYSWDKIADQTIAVYNELLDDGSARRLPQSKRSTF